ncbi:protein NUCLEAR FUSION DEFECTIVE 4-like [Punica granatum]|uniref:Uncharacterized protein n=2 Tax=Punica granatum TaxID=22663 RepID=A0A218WC54_PUNGR|nr:protein NUCLEAR FUSION DEFECTIVE 4-like [Punica granatum]OWM70236.1 hypothetical protein CDL15_Pgr026086 [Punica granatum]PKI34893.1 hypothetical protein CRG98_044739 [Punica granatum]
MAASSGNRGCCGFVSQVIKGRWFMMFASFLIMAGAGATYLFGVYSKDIKSVLGYDQSTLNLLGSFKDLGANVGVLSGLLAEVAPTWFVLLVGSAMNFVGYFMIWMSVTQRVARPAVWQMCLYICIGANSQNFANTGSLVTCVKNFPESRGMMLGLMKGFVGLSGAIFTQLYHAIYGDDSKNMILLIGWLPAAVSVVFVYTIRTMKVSSHPNERKVFYDYLYITLALAFLLMGLTISQKQVSFSHAAYVGGTVVICALTFMPLAIAIREEYATWKQRKNPVPPPTSIIVSDPNTVPQANPNNSAQTEKKLEEESSDSKGPSDSCCANIFSPPERGQDYTILQALLSLDMIILFIATFCGLGCSLTAVDNLGQIGESLEYPKHTISTFVSLVSIWNYFGRVFAGFVSETIYLRWRVPRPVIMMVALVLSALGDLLVAFPIPGSVYIASLLIGFSFGAQLTLLFVVISELFGLKYYSTLFNCGQLASPLGSYILNVLVVGKLYDREAAKQLALKGMTRDMVKELVCIGKQCYRLSFIILAGANLFGALVLLILIFRTKKYYGGDIYKRYRDEIAATNRSTSDGHEKELALTSSNGAKT